MFTRLWIKMSRVIALGPCLVGVAMAHELPVPGAKVAPPSLSTALHLGEPVWAAIAIGMGTAVCALTLLSILRSRSPSRMYRVPLELIQALASSCQGRVHIARNGRELVEVTGDGACALPRPGDAPARLRGGWELRVEEPTERAATVPAPGVQTAPWLAFDESGDAMALIGADGMVAAVNRALRRLLGKGQDDVLATPWQEALGLDDHALSLPALAAAPAWMSAEAVLSDGRLVSLVVRRGVDPMIGEFHLVILRPEAEDRCAAACPTPSDHLSAALIERLPMGVLMLNGDGTVARANRRAEVLLSRCTAEMEGLPVPFLVQVDRRLGQGPGGGALGRVLTSRRHTLVELHEIALSDGPSGHHAVVFEAADAVSQAEREAQQMRTLTLSEVGRAVIHQLRQPLHAASLLVERVQRVAASEKVDRDAVLDDCETVLDQIDETNVLLDLWRGCIARHQPEARTTLKAAVSAAVLALASELDGVGLRLEPRHGCDHLLPVSRRRLAQALIEILRNAAHAVRLRHGLDAQRHGHVVMECDVVDGRVTVSVSDNGGGFPDVSPQGPMEPFFSAWQDGVADGLGLTFCKQLAEQVGGRLSWERRETGSVVHLVLPVVTSAPLGAPLAAAPVAAAVPVPAGRLPRVLLVDDEALPLMMAQEFLEARGYAVHTAGDGLDAWAACQQTAFDAVITDLRMPRMGGLDLIEALGALYPKVPVLVMTGYREEGLRLPANVAGVVGKPFQLMELEEWLRRVLDPADAAVRT